MPEISLSQVLPIASLLIAAAALWRNLKGDNKADQAAMTTVIVKLETIIENVKDLKNDFKELKAENEDIKERLTAVEASAKSAHKRIDNLENENRN